MYFRTEVKIEKRDDSQTVDEVIIILFFSRFKKTRFKSMVIKIQK